MPFLLEVAIGGVAFSLLSSLAVVAREAQRSKTPYKKWLAEIEKINVVRYRR